MAQGLYKLSKTISYGVDLPYLLYLPQGYDGQLKWPLIIFLHGAGERGTDLQGVLSQGLPKRLHQGQDIPFIVVSPQVPPHETWEHYRYDVMALLDHVLASYPVYEDRVYLTGLSMGGFGTWRYLTWYPDRFAAAAPICGGMPWLVDLTYATNRIKHIPIWTFHGAQDSIVPVEYTRQVVNALQAVGGNIKYTEYPDLDHDSWTVTYNNSELYTWFQKHRLQG